MNVYKPSANANDSTLRPMFSASASQMRALMFRSWERSVMMGSFDGEHRQSLTSSGEEAPRPLGAGDSGSAASSPEAAVSESSPPAMGSEPRGRDAGGSDDAAAVGGLATTAGPEDGVTVAGPPTRP